MFTLIVTHNQEIIFQKHTDDAYNDDFDLALLKNQNKAQNSHKMTRAS